MKNQSTFRRPTYMYAIRTPSPPEPKGEGKNSPESVFVDLFRRPGIDSQPGGPVRNPICRTGPPGYIGWRNRFLRIDSWAPWTSTNTSSAVRGRGVLIPTTGEKSLVLCLLCVFNTTPSSVHREKSNARGQSPNLYMFKDSRNRFRQPM